MNYLSTDSEPRGELCVRGENLFKGYYKRPELNKEVIDEYGWFHTGDVAKILPNGCVKIIDRKKNIFKLSQGEYIAPEKLENVYLKSPFISQIFVHGDSLKTFLVAIITLDEGVVQNWAKDNDVAEDEIYESDLLNKTILADLKSRAETAKCKSFLLTSP